MDDNLAEKLADEVASLTDEEKITFLRYLSKKIKPCVVHSPMFNASCYIGISANWIEIQNKD